MRADLPRNHLRRFQGGRKNAGRDRTLVMHSTPGRVSATSLWPSGDCAFGSDQPSSGLDRADGIELLVLIFPASLLTEIHDVVGTDEHPALRIDVSDCREKAPRGGGPLEIPGLSAIAGKSQVGNVVARMLIVAADDNAVQRVAKCNGENAGGVGTVDERSIDDSPGLTTVGRMEDAGGFASGGKPNVAIGDRSQPRDRGVGCGKCSFACERLRQSRSSQGVPGSAIVGEKQFELEFAGVVRNRVAQHDAVFRIPESHRVEESPGIVVLELKLPVEAAIAGVINAGLIPGTRRHQESFVGRKGDDGAEVKVAGFGNLTGRPTAASVERAEIGAVRAAGPRGLARDRAYSAKTFRGV